MDNRPTYSLLIPAYNEEEVLPKLKSELDKLIPKLGGSFEVVFINDGSKDKTAEILNGYCKASPSYKVIHLARNFGHQAALAAGFDFASGEAVIVMDADLQDPPELILEFIKKWKEGYQVVYGIRKAREGETWFKKFTANSFYKIISWFSKIKIPENVSDFRLLDRRVVEELRKLREQHLFWRGLIPWVGFKQTGVEFVRQPRAAGATHYPFRKMLRFAIDGLASFSIRPLKISTYAGFLIASLSFILGVWAILDKFIFGTPLRGWASLMTAIMFLGGVQLIMIGVLGEYVGRTYEESKKRPLYVVGHKINI